jgi:hypothetical protein
VLLKSDNYLTKLIGKISEKDKQKNGVGIGESFINSNADDPNFWDNFSNDKKEVVLTSEEFLKPVEIEIEAPKVDSLSKKKTTRTPRAKKTAIK